jgi:hypothetical protein
MGNGSEHFCSASASGPASLAPARKRVSASAEKAADLAHVDLHVFGAKADPHFSVGQLFEEKAATTTPSIARM